MGSKLNIILGASLCAFAFASPASAADLGAGFSVTGGATLVSNYRFCGISQTDKRFAIQGTFLLNHKSGFYATVWSSSIDDYVAYGSNAEVDLVGGYRKTFGSTTIDVGLLYYYYPGSHGADTNFVEPNASVAQVIGLVTAKLNANYAPRQSALTTRLALFYGGLVRSKNMLSVLIQVLMKRRVQPRSQWRHCAGVHEHLCGDCRSSGGVGGDRASRA